MMQVFALAKELTLYEYKLKYLSFLAKRTTKIEVSMCFLQFSSNKMPYCNKT